MHFKPEISSAARVGVGVAVLVESEVDEFCEVATGVAGEGVERGLEPPAGVMVAGPRK